MPNALKHNAPKPDALNSDECRGIGIPRFRRAGTYHFSLGNWLLAGEHPEQLLQQNDEQMHRVVPTLSMLAGLFLP
jgi:hypothetical protein